MCLSSAEQHSLIVLLTLGADGQQVNHSEESDSREAGKRCYARPGRHRVPSVYG